MSKPQSFKDLFKNKPQVPLNQNNQSLASIIKPINKDYFDKIEGQRKELTAFVNKERCVVCGSQLDGPVNEKDAKLYCVEYPQHYTCRYEFGTNNLTNSIATHSFVQDAYEIRSQLLDNLEYRNQIYKLDLQLDSYTRRRNQKLILSYIGAYLKFPKNLSEQDFLKKIKLYSTFI